MLRREFPPCAAIGVGAQFEISYAKEPVPNVRHGRIERWCHEHKVPYKETTDSAAMASFAAEQGAELGLVAGWYHLIPRSVRSRFSRGVVGIHASLLPMLRGGAPLNWAILSGLQETGVTLFELGDGVDDGPIYGQVSVALGARTTIGELVELAEAASLRLVGETLPLIDSGAIETRAQTGTATYGLQRAPDDGRIDWSQSAEQIDRLVRATGRPYPGAFTAIEGRVIRIWSGQHAAAPSVFGRPGQIARVPEHAEPCVVTGSGILVVQEATFNDGTDALSLLRASNNRRLASP